MQALTRDLLRPGGVAAHDISACLGLISDTHCPERLDRLPEAVARVFAGVDLILHAGDIGSMAVLDELSAAAPVVAVHGNDERVKDVQTLLPYQQVMSAAGRRIVLTHSHRTDDAAEAAVRREDAWGPKLDWRASLAHAAGADIVVYGHSHVPMDVVHQGVRLVNPGALASGNFAWRQAHKTVALVYLLKDGTSRVVHVDLAAPDRPFTFRIDWDAGFRAALVQFQKPLFNSSDQASYGRLRERVRALGPDTAASLRDAMRHTCMPAWTGHHEALEWADVVHGIETAPGLTPAVRATLTDAAKSVRPNPIASRD